MQGTYEINDFFTLAVRRPDYFYPSFGKGLSTAETEFFDEALDKGLIIGNMPERALELYIVRYVGTVIDTHCDSDFKRNTERLSTLRNLYGKPSPSLKRKISGWLFDYCLVNESPSIGLELCSDPSFPLPFEKEIRISDLMQEIESGVYRPETEKRLSLAIPFLSEYDYRTSRFYVGNEKVFEAAINAAVYALLKKLYRESREEIIPPERITEARSAYIGLMNDTESARILTASYLPFSECQALKSAVTFTVQYTENLLRQGLGVKVKLSGIGLSSDDRKICADAVREELPGFLPTPAKVGRKPKPKSEEAAKKSTSEEDEPCTISLDIDFSRAKRLEAESWRIASMLGSDYGSTELSLSVDALTDAGNTSTFISEEASETVASAKASRVSAIPDGIPEEWAGLCSSLTDSEVRVIRELLDGGDITALSRSLGGMAEGFIDSINEKASDTYGDVIIDTSGNAPSFYEDYRDELYEIFNSIWEAK